MELGTLLVKLSANTTGFASQMAGAAKAVEQFANGAKRISGELGQAGVAITAFGGAMTALAATVDGGAKKSLDDMHAASASLAVQVADILKPAMEELTSVLKEAADYVANLSPETKKLVANFAVMAVSVGIAGMALQKVFGVVSALASIWQGLSLALASPAFLGAAAVAGAFALALGSVLVVTAVIVDNWSLFADGFDKVVKFMSGLWKDFTDGLMMAWKATIEFIAKGLDAMGLDDWADKFRKAMEPASLKSAFQGLADGLGDFLKDVGVTALDSVERGLDKMKKYFAGGVGESVGAGARLPSITGKTNPDAYDYSSGLADEMARDEKFRRQELDADAAMSGGPQQPEKQATVAQAVAVNTGGAIANAVLSKLGEVGSIVSNVVQAGMTGGPWAAFIAAIMEIVSRMKGFSDVLDSAMQLIYTLAEALEPILTPIFEFLKDVFADIGKIFKDLAPLWRALGKLIEWLLTPIMYLIKGIEWLVAEISGTNNRNKRSEILASTINETDPAKFQEKRTQYDQLFGAGAYEADALASNDFLTITKSLIDTALAQKKAQEDANKAVNEFNEALSEATQNVPKGVKLALARFNSQDGVMPGSAAQEAPYSIGPVYVNAASGKQLWDELVGVAAGEANLKMGTSAPMLRALKGF